MLERRLLSSLKNIHRNYIIFLARRFRSESVLVELGRHKEQKQAMLEVVRLARVVLLK